MEKSSQCENCKFAELSDSESVISFGNTTVVQKGKTNIICKYPHFVRNISIIDGELRCSGFRKGGES